MRTPRWRRNRHGKPAKDGEDDEEDDEDEASRTLARRKRALRDPGSSSSARVQSATHISKRDSWRRQAARFVRSVARSEARWRRSSADAGEGAASRRCRRAEYIARASSIFPSRKSWFAASRVTVASSIARDKGRKCRGGGCFSTHFTQPAPVPEGVNAAPRPAGECRSKGSSTGRPRARCPRPDPPRHGDDESPVGPRPPRTPVRARALGAGDRSERARHSSVQHRGRGCGSLLARRRGPQLGRSVRPATADGAIRSPAPLPARGLVHTRSARHLCEPRPRRPPRWTVLHVRRADGWTRCEARENGRGKETTNSRGEKGQEAEEEAWWIVCGALVSSVCRWRQGEVRISGGRRPGA